MSEGFKLLMDRISKAPMDAVGANFKIVTGLHDPLQVHFVSYEREWRYSGCP
jgi:hypothetical protein